ncbi:MAG TPA: lysozyme inhibitor LprI family protein [Burkholderiales bacterium]|nr:lysozyme inhibitor LprI family protein [Burkholderiales bacterium]
MEEVLEMTRLRIDYIAFVLALLSTPIVLAADCRNPQNQTEMNQCAAQDLEQVTKEINKLYTEYRGRLNEPQKQQLKEIQLAWIKFRDLACKFDSSGVAGGSAYPFVMQSCLIEKTRVRLKELQTLANCQEGDLSCPAWK